MPIGDSDDNLQFTKLELDQAGSGDLRCSVLGTEITDDYYLVNGQVYSAEAKESLAAQSAVTSGGASRFSKAVSFGAIAALLGSLLYFLVSWLTGYELGLISIVVGIMVGKAVFIGSGNRGGRKYQVLAVALTYLSIVSSYAPLAIMQLSEEREPTEQSEVVAGGDVSSGDVTTSEAPPAAAAELGEEEGEFGMLGFVFLIGLLLALPFLSGLENLLGLAIIAFGLWEAWKLTARAEYVVEGPFSVRTEPVSEPA